MDVDLRNLCQAQLERLLPDTRRRRVCRVADAMNDTVFDAGGMTLLPRLLPSVVLAVLLAAFVAPCTTRAAIHPGRFEKEVLVAACNDPMQLEVLRDGRILFIERGGAIKMYGPRTRQVSTVGILPVAAYAEVGLLGLAVAPDFETSGHVFLFYCPQSDRAALRLSRFVIRDGTLASDSESILLQYRWDDGGNHMGGGLAWGPDGCLYVGTGDNCPPIPELPVDQRPGKEHRDALRTSANSQDLRGKILRIRPRPDGGYDIPAGNLFSDPAVGRPEIFCMGIRNAFRLSVDSRTGWVYWGDVGPNVNPSFGLGPEGYDEINLARSAGNYGWPMATGPNEPYRNYDFALEKAGERFNLAAPLNESRNNTGIKRLPPARPAVIWYPTAETEAFPGLGSGGRSAMAGPVYRDRPEFDPQVKMPAEYDGACLCFDWMRNWIKVVKADEAGEHAAIAPFAPGMDFRRPIEVKIGPDGAVYVIEFGDKWAGNVDSRVVRVVYRRGNRGPTATVKADPPAGRHPLPVTLDAGASFDRDGDPLTFAWFAGSATEPFATGPVVRQIIDQPGSHPFRVVARDPHGSLAEATTIVHAGNSPPTVTFLAPRNGSFFESDEPLEYRVVATDHEDGSTENGRIAPMRVTVRADVRARADKADVDPGLAVMRRSNCFGCHSQTTVAGAPAYADVAKKYEADASARERLARKVIAGGAGVWGPYQMPAQSHLDLHQARQAIDWILQSARQATGLISVGADGVVVAPKSVAHQSRRLILSASLTDGGSEGVPSLTGEHVITLLSRRQKAAFAESIVEGAVFDVFAGGEGLVVRLDAGGSVSFGQVDLTGIDHVLVRLEATSEGEVLLRAGSPVGDILGRVIVPRTLAFETLTIPISRGDRQPVLFCLSSTKAVTINWVEFAESESERLARSERTARTRALRAAEAATERPRSVVHKWTVADLLPRLSEVSSGRSVGRAWRVFQQAKCATCHRLGGFGGTTGPDLAAAWARLSARPEPRLAALEAILEPSRVVAAEYKPVRVVTTDGVSHQGLVVSQDSGVVRLRSLNPGQTDVVEIPRRDIEELATVETSPMPAGLMDAFTVDEILDLLALLEAGGDPGHPVFQPRSP